MKFNILILIFFYPLFNVYSQEVLGEEVPVEVEYRDHKRDFYQFEELDIQICSGFSDRAYTFNVYLNDRLIRTFECITNRSIGKCMISGGRRARIILHHDEFNEGDLLIIEIEGEYTRIPLTKKYSDLVFSRGNVWRAIYVRGYIEKDVE